MAKVWCVVIVLIFVQNALGRLTCGKNNDIQSCDECVKCGAKWCNQVKLDGQCSYADSDDWCSDTEMVTMDPEPSRGKSLQPTFAKRTLYINQDDLIPFSYKADGEREISIMISNTTQNKEAVKFSTSKPTCSSGTCNLNIAVKVSEHFCKSPSYNMDLIHISVKVESIAEEAVIKYHVPCACECIKKPQHDAPQCGGRGTLICGTCECYEGWVGPRCEKTQCSDRGDVPNTCHELGCSNNGYCGPCGNCLCYHDREGSQYFDPKNLCSDICMAISDLEANCGPCLTSPVNGTCLSSPEKPECYPRNMMEYDETILTQRDELGRKTWVKCNDTLVLEDGEQHFIEYFVMMEEEMYWMMLINNNGNSQGVVAGGGGATQTKVPLILGVLGILAAVAAVGGVFLWKHLNSAPPMPFASPDYQNIDAEDCVGENPLYKPPTSTFTNPQFGKC